MRLAATVGGTRAAMGSQKRGKAHLSTPSLEGIQRSGLRTACHHFNEPPPGMSGWTRSFCCSWQGIYVDVLCRSWHHWLKLVKRLTAMLLRVCMSGLILGVAILLPRTSVIPARGMTRVLLHLSGSWSVRHYVSLDQGHSSPWPVTGGPVTQDHAGTSSFWVTDLQGTLCGCS